MAQVAGLHTATGMSLVIEHRLEQGLVPFLPDDVALQCLLRVPVQSYSQLQNVCRKWRDLVNSSEFYEHRKKEGTTRQCVCLLQAIPRRNSNSQQRPMFSVSVANDRNSWERLPAIPDFDHLSLPIFSRFAAVGGSLVILGGWDPSTMEELRSVYIFSFSSWTWRRGADMPTTRSFFSCGVVEDTILVAGGHDTDKNALRSAARYKFHEDVWEILRDMHTERDECAGAVLGGKFYVISGYSTSAQGKFRRDAEVYDPKLDKWTQLDDMCPADSKAVRPRSIVATAGRLFAFYHNQLIVYSPEENLWHLVDIIPKDCHGISFATCATAIGNRIIVTGPSNTDDDTHRTLVYKLSSSTYSAGDNMCNGHWEIMPADEDFLGIAHVSCVVEV